MDESEDDIIETVICVIILLLFLICFGDRLVMVLNWILDSLKYIVA